MKTQISITLWLLLLLVSCGQNKSTAKLKISAGFAMSANTSFAGGLVVVAQGPNGEIISRPLSLTSGTESIVEVLLPEGAWKFSAVAWDGITDPIPGILKGKTFCDSIGPIQISGTDASINLNVNSEKCQTALGDVSNYYLQSPTPGNFMNITVGTCGWLYKDNSGNKVDSSTPSSWCNETAGSLPPDVISHANSVRLSIADIASDGRVIPSQLSVCLAQMPEGTLSNGYVSTSLKIPVNVVPVQVELFKTNNCEADQKINEYLFNKGLKSSYANFDSYLNSYAGTTNLFLPTSVTKRGYTPYLGILPIIECASSGTIMPNCFNLPVVPNAAQIYIEDGQQFVFAENALDNACSTLGELQLKDDTDSSIIDSFSAGEYFCDVDEGKILISINSANLAESCSGTKCILKNMATPSYSVTVSTNSTGMNNLAFINNIFEGVGQGISILGPAKNSLWSLYENDHSQGLMSRAREIFLPDGPAGLLVELTCDQDLSVGKEISFMEEGEQKTYQVYATYANEPIPAAICSNSSAANCDVSTFTRKLVVRRKIENAYLTQQLAYFHCIHKIGMIENQQNEIKDGKIRKEKNLLYWNATSTNYQRAESYSYEIESDLTTSSVTRISTQFSRLEKTSEKDMIVDQFGFDSRRENSLFTPQLNARRINFNDSDVNIINHHLSSPSLATDLTGTGIFTDQIISKLLNTPSIKQDGAIAFSPNGKNMIQVVSIGTNFTIYSNIDGVRNYIPTLNANTGQTILKESIKVAINDHGDVIVAWIAPYSSLNAPYTAYFDKNMMQWKFLSSTTLSASFNPPNSRLISLSYPAIKMGQVFIENTAVNPKSEVYWLQEASTDQLVYKWKLDPSLGTVSPSVTITGGWPGPVNDFIVYKDNLYTYIVYHYNDSLDDYINVTICNTSTCYPSTAVYVGETGSNNLYLADRDDNDPTTNSFAVYINNTPTNMLKKYLVTVNIGTGPSSGSIAPLTAEDLAYAGYQLRPESVSYCISRSSPQFGSGSLSTCNEQNISQYFPIKSFKYDYKSLMPAVFDTFFSAGFAQKQ